MTVRDIIQIFFIGLACIVLTSWFIRNVQKEIEYRRERRKKSEDK